MGRRSIKLLFVSGVLCIFLLLRLEGPFSSLRQSPRRPACAARLPSSSGVAGSITMEKRLELYQKMEADLDNNGAAFLDGGKTSQSLKISELFEIVDKKIIPVHKPASPPVRATILHLQHQYASKIATMVKRVLSPHFSTGVWYQDPQLYHSSLFHASHHLEPVPASVAEILAESAAVGQVARSCCPLEVTLDRVVLTSTGVLLGCWQVQSGTDPADIREKLRQNLTRAPRKQIYASEVLHTSFARIIGPPDISTKAGVSKDQQLSLMKTLVLQLNKELCNFQATIQELWFVEELDILALALNGRTEVEKFLLGCSSFSPQ